MLEISLSSLGAWFLIWAIFWFVVVPYSTFVVVENVQGSRDVRRVSWAFFWFLVFCCCCCNAAAVADSGDGDGDVAAAVAVAAVSDGNVT